MLKILLTLIFLSFFTRANGEINIVSVNELWRSHLKSELDPFFFFSNIDKVKSQSLADELRLNEIKNYYNNEKGFNYYIDTKLSKVDALKIYSDLKLYNSQSLSFSKENEELIHQARLMIKSAESGMINEDELRELLINTPDYANYNNGHYKNGLKLFLICRKNRTYPCLFVMKDIFDQFVTDEKGEMWSMPALAHSWRELPFNITNGETPTGVHTIDSVMPYANNQEVFGKFRRLILNWIPSDKYMADFLPQTSTLSSWWKQASIARDVGRLYLRIHGTGKVNEDPHSNYYPHVGTSGCISVREGLYDKEYYDQRLLLDKMMESMQMAPSYSEEVHLSGVLYVVNLNRDKKPVSLDEIQKIVNP